MVNDYSEGNNTEMNMALLTLQRIHYSLSYCSEHKRNKDYVSWFDELLVLLGEASVYMKGDPIHILPTKYKEEFGYTSIKQLDPIKDEFYRVRLIVDKIDPLISKVKSNQPIDYKDLHDKLFYLTILITNILKPLLMKFKDDARFAL